MMSNLFSMFDPYTLFFFPFNWLSTFIFFIVLPFSYWLLNSRNLSVLNNLMTYIYSEFSNLIKVNSFLLFSFFSIFLFILLNNFMGLFPYIFTSTSHLSISLSLSLLFWFSFILYGVLTGLNNMMYHLVPSNTPFVLKPLMVVIELISLFIRPFTLAIRLSANMIAWHLLVDLLSSATQYFLNFYFVMGFVQIGLSSLELAVAMIQAYVFSVLLTLYASEVIH